MQTNPKNGSIIKDVSQKKTKNTSTLKKVRGGN